MRNTIILVTVVLLLGFVGVWTLNHSQGTISDTVNRYVENGEFQTLEAKYTPEQIMEAHKKELLTDSQKTFGPAELKYYPHLLMDVKYLDSEKKPREGVIIWSLSDGEMVLNAESWEKTHGFEDAINANATRNEFRIINALAKNKGALTRDQLLKELQLEADVADPWIESAIEKYLITKKGSELLLHLQNPKLAVSPQTKINRALVTKPYGQSQRGLKKYTSNQIEKISRAAFGSDFAIRSMNEIALPVYSIEVINPDGSVLTSLWNAINGQRINPKYLSE